MTVSTCPYCSSIYFSDWKESDITPGDYFNKCSDCSKWSQYDNDNNIQLSLPEDKQLDVSEL